MLEYQVAARTDDATDFTVYLRGGQWIADECVFEFEVPEQGLAGVVRCDWREPCPRFDLSDGTPSDELRVRILQYLSNQLRGFHRGGYAGLSDADLEAIYDASYHETESYSAGLERERARKRHMAELVQSCVRPRKVLVAGCSAGETVRQLRALDIDAWGFDICPDLEEIAYPDVRPFVRQGSITEIPFDERDGFDTLTAFDLFEHIPEERVPQAIDELARLGVQNVVALIAHCEFECTGHVTLRPLSWWEAQFSPRFKRVPSGELECAWPSVDQSHRANSLLRVWTTAS